MGCGLGKADRMLSPYSSPDSGAYARYVWMTLIGQWAGRMLIPSENSYMAMIQNPNLPNQFGLRIKDCIGMYSIPCCER